MTPIGRYLVEFSVPAGVLDPSDGATLSLLDPHEEGPGDQAEARLAEARREGFLEGEAAAQAAAAEHVATLEAEHKGALATERQTWVEQQGKILAAQLQGGIADLEAKLAATLADLLEPILHAGVRAKALDEVRETIATLLAGQAGKLVRVSGPADLMEALQASFANTAALTIEPTEAPEVTVQAGDTTVETHLKAWAARLAAAIEDARS